MPKIATKFVADVAVKVGRQSMIIKIPLDLADLKGSTLEDAITDAADAKVREELRFSVENLPALKSAHKAYKKAHP